MVFKIYSNLNFSGAWVTARKAIRLTRTSNTWNNLLFLSVEALLWICWSLIITWCFSELHLTCLCMLALPHLMFSAFTSSSEFWMGRRIRRNSPQRPKAKGKGKERKVGGWNVQEGPRHPNLKNRGIPKHVSRLSKYLVTQPLYHTPAPPQFHCKCQSN